jgi:hypothetical protein
MRKSYKPVATGFLVRLMSPLGRYPTESFVSESSALIISSDISFSVARIEKEDWSFSEVDCLNALELPLYGSVLLSGKAGTQYLYPYPTPVSETLETDSLEKIDDQNITECKSFLIQKCSALKKEGYGTSYFHKPPILGGSNYEFVANAADEDDQHKILAKLDKSNALILRAVNCLLKARMAFLHSELGEAACIYLWIALDAAHSLVLQKLRDSGVKNPTSADAARYFEKLSGHGTDWEQFFEDDYMNRIRAIHPDNRFGAEAIPQFLADDFLELNDLLIPFFHFFVTELSSDSQTLIHE